MAEQSLKYPITFNSYSGAILDPLHISLDSSIRLLFLTNKGERAIFKTAGSRLRQRLEQIRTSDMDRLIAIEAEADIRDNIPDAEPLTITVEWLAKEKTYNLEIVYFNKITGQTRNLSVTL